MKLIIAAAALVALSCTALAQRVDIPTTNSSGNVANAAAVATLAAVAGRLTYITGFQCTSGGATASASVIIAVTGTIGGTNSHIFTVPVIGATNQGANGVISNFPHPIPATAINTAIVVTMPALGAGNTHAACSAQGFHR